jgi:PilZ domain
MATDDKMAAASAFLRSLNISLKFVRLYGLDHARAVEQFQATWEELQDALRVSGESGLLVGASGSQLLLDGVPLPATPAGRSVAQLLTSAGLASIQFLPDVTQEQFGGFVRAFSSGTAKGSAGGEQIRAALAEVGGIRINPVRFIAENAPAEESHKDIPPAKEHPIDQQIRAWQKDPEKLLQALASRQAGGAPAAASPYSGVIERGALQGAGDAAVSPHSSVASKATAESSASTNAEGERQADTAKPPQDSSTAGEPEAADREIASALRLLAEVAQGTSGEGVGPQAGLEALREKLGSLPERPRRLLQQALATLAGQTLTMRANDAVLLRLAEHLAVRFALERYDRGASATAIQQLLDRMGEEIRPLRKIPGANSKPLMEGGFRAEIPADLLERQFWSAVPKARQRAVIASPEAWCIPPRIIRQLIDEMVHRGDPAAATILENYARGVNDPDAAARRRAAIGLAELADLYGGEAPALVAAIRCAGGQLSAERDDEVQSLISTAFVRLAEQAGARRLYGAVLQSLDSVGSVEDQRPAFAQSLRERLGLDKHLGDFLEEAIHTTSSYPDGILDVIGRMPRSAAEYLAARFNRATQREETGRIVEVAQAAGAEIVASLREILQVGPPAEAAETVGLLSRWDAEAVEKSLGTRLREWPRLAQDRALRLLAASESPERGRLLLAIFDQLHPTLLPLAVDEIGLSGEPSALEPLLRMASGDLPKGTGEYLRLKAVEALGRLHAASATELLRGIVEAKKLWHWQYSSELRIAAMQVLGEVAPDWARHFLPKSGFSAGDLEFGPQAPSAGSPWFRQRRYPRVHLSAALPATATSERGTISLEVRDLSLSGGLASGEKLLTPGTQVTLRLGSGLHPVRVLAVMRGARAQGLSFEFADMDLEERARLRRMIREYGLPPSATGTGEALPSGTLH